MADALGMIETRSFPATVEAADAMVKAAKVNLLRATTICSGRYMIQISGDQAAVEAALATVADCPARIIGHYLLPQVSNEVLEVLRRSTGVKPGQAIAVIEAPCSLASRSSSAPKSWVLM